MSTLFSSAGQMLAAQGQDLGRTDWLDSRREELIERMHQRRDREVGGGYGRSSGYGGSGGYGAPGGSKSYTRSWRPGGFKFG